MLQQIAAVATISRCKFALFPTVILDKNSHGLCLGKVIYLIVIIEDIGNVLSCHGKYKGYASTASCCSNLEMLQSYQK